MLNAKTCSLEKLHRKISMTNDYDPDMLDELLPIYYRKLFPYKPYMQWICGGNFINDEEDLKIPDKNYVSRREFCFTLKEDIYIRYLSFSSAEDLKEAMVGRVPHKIDIGAIFNAKPSDHKKVTNFQPLEKVKLRLQSIFSFVNNYKGLYDVFRN